VNIKRKQALTSSTAVATGDLEEPAATFSAEQDDDHRERWDWEIENGNDREEKLQRGS